MTAPSPTACAQITKERLRLWQRRNEREGHASTPAVLVNVCHGPQSGQIIINTTEDLPNDKILACLLFAAEQLKQKIKEGN